LANTKYSPLCDGIHGKIGALNVDDNYIQHNYEMPINIILNYSNSLEGEKEENILVGQIDLQDPSIKNI
jgi:hypothetical protein